MDDTAGNVLCPMSDLDLAIGMLGELAELKEDTLIQHIPHMQPILNDYTVAIIATIPVAGFDRDDAVQSPSVSAALQRLSETGWSCSDAEAVERNDEVPVHFVIVRVNASSRMFREVEKGLKASLEAMAGEVVSRQHVGLRLRVIRESFGLSLYDFCARKLLDPAAWHRVEEGDTPPSREMVTLALAPEEGYAPDKATRRAVYDAFDVANARTEQQLCIR